jgi:hypothetical protein
MGRLWQRGEHRQDEDQLGDKSKVNSKNECVRTRILRCLFAGMECSLNAENFLSGSRDRKKAHYKNFHCIVLSGTTGSSSFKKIPFRTGKLLDGFHST